LPTRRQRARGRLVEGLRRPRADRPHRTRRAREPRRGASPPSAFAPHGRAKRSAGPGCCPASVLSAGASNEHQWLRRCGAGRRAGDEKAVRRGLDVSWEIDITGRLRDGARPQARTWWRHRAKRAVCACSC
jgi:hypothetical protein